MSKTLNQLSPKELLKDLTVERITPSVAKMYLDTMGPQRNHRPFKIAQYADDMKNDRWEFNGATIMFDRQGRLRDGQNRLMALIQANVTLPFAVIRNASEETIATVDTGMSRTMGDVNKMQGVPYYVDIAAACTWWWKYERGLCSTMSARGTHKEMILVRDAHLTSLIEAVKLVGVSKNAKALVPKSILVFVVSYLYEKDPDVAQEFLISLDTGLGVAATDPLFSLRRNLTNNLSRRTRLPSHIVLAMVIKAFNLRYRGITKQHLTFRNDEQFPEFVL